jgi:DNA polymerase III delta subunit
MNNENPIIIIYGENKIESKDYLYRKIQEFKKQNHSIKRINASEFSLNKVEETLGSSNLFAEKEVIIFEDCLKKPLKQLKPILDLINQTKKTLVFFDNGKVRTTTSKKIKYSEIKEFPLKNNLFKFLDELNPKTNKKNLLHNYHQVVKTNPGPLVFAMIIRQFQMLILAKSNKLNSVAPFIKQKTNQQAKDFSIEKLNLLLNDLISIDYEQKTSKNLLILEKKLDLFLLKM